METGRRCISFEQLRNKNFKINEAHLLKALAQAQKSLGTGHGGDSDRGGVFENSGREVGMISENELKIGYSVSSLAFFLSLYNFPITNTETRPIIVVVNKIPATVLCPSIVKTNPNIKPKIPMPNPKY